MANYAGAITEYNPYISQIPVDAYTKVGMFKQQQRDAGVQRIQSVVDNIAGLDIVNSADREYLQQRVGELTTELNKYGGIDFSNPNFVKQLSGLAQPIYNDENIINSVSSSTNIRQLQKSQQEALRTGKAENFSVDYENATYLQPYLNSKVVGQRYDGPTNTLSGSVTETRKRFMTEIEKFKPDKYLTQSSANPMYQVQTEKGLETMDKSRLSNYVLSTMSNDERELLKRSAWADNRQLSNSQLIEKAQLMNVAKSRKLLETAKQFDDQSKGFADGSDMYKYFSQISKAYRDDYDDQVNRINRVYSSLNPDKLSVSQRDLLYSDIGSTYFAQGIAEGVSYSDVSNKEKENTTWKTIYEADRKSIDNAVNNNQINVSPRLDEKGNLLGLIYSDNPYKNEVGGKKPANSSSTGSGLVDNQGNMIETNVPLIAGPDDKMQWTYPTYNKILSDLQAKQVEITKSTYQFLKEANIDVDQYFEKFYDKNPKGVVGQVTRWTVKKGYEGQVDNLIGALETAVDSELTYGDITSKMESGQSTGNPQLDKKVAELNPEVRSKFMPSLKYILDSKSGRTYIKDVLEKKKEYANMRSILANTARKYAEIEYGGDPDRLRKIRAASDEEVLNFGISSEGNWQYSERLDPRTNQVIVERSRGGGRTELGDHSKAETQIVSSKIATPLDIERLKYREPGAFDLVDPNYHPIKSSNQISLYKDGFDKKFDQYLQNNVSARTENMYTTVFSNMMGKLGEVGKRQLMTAILEQNGIPADEGTLNSANITIGGYDNNNTDNPLEKTPKLRMNYSVKDKDGKSHVKSVDVNMSALIDANKGKQYLGKDNQPHKHPFVELFDAFQYMPQATAIMMDPYHGSRLNDRLQDWNIISDRKGNKAMKYRVVWTGDDVDPRQVATEDNLRGNLSSSQAYVEVFVPGKGKVLITNPNTGNLQSFSHPALALKWLHDTFELRSETELNDFYKYLSK